jgi:hypothetical protein
MTLSLASRSYVDQVMALTADGDLLIAGSTSATSATNHDLLLVRLQGGAGAPSGLQGATPTSRHRSPKRIAMELAAAAGARHRHRSPKRRALDQAGASGSDRSPKQIALEQARQQAGTLFASNESKMNQIVFGSD